MGRTLPKLRGIRSLLPYVRRAISDDLVAAASAYLGQDIKEVASQRRNARVAAADSEPQERTVAEDFAAKAERAGEQMRKRRY